ncbi:hypothetical protein [Kordiimonas gwangyangensis]|uniref:hypothetical protein n=1 Tax=Kordiimonas gwangyangensis TaxID=288022 RepID=UPI0004720D51|nr:hypothetical protein [Kordiimonas gwangyangensis]
MILREAQDIVSKLLMPVPYDTFFSDHMSKKPLALLGDNTGNRSLIIGDDPRASILAGFAKYATELTCISAHLLHHRRNHVPSKARQNSMN